MLKKNLNLCASLVLCLVFCTLINDAHSQELDTYFPRQRYPKLDSSSTTVNPQNESLRGGIKSLGKEIQSKVKSVSRRRNVSCFGDPCLLQGLPLLYNIPDSGFFGGFQANFTNISRTEPYYYALNMRVVRSDNNQWLSFARFDVPEVSFFSLFNFRLRLRGSYFRSSEFRYSGEGLQGEALFNSNQDRLRYLLRDFRSGATIQIPMNLYRNSNLGVYFTYDYSYVQTEDFGEFTNVLYEKKPLGYQGGTYRTAGFGIYSDSRDREILTRQGSFIEWGFNVGHLEETSDLSYRVTLIDRRYYSKRRWTLAHRLTVDGLFGAPPFWELTAVGGVEPIRDLSASGILKGFPEGRFHENLKVIESAELRIHQNQFQAFGQSGDLAMMLVGLDVGILNEVFVWSVATGFDIFWNKSFLTRTYFAYAKPGWSLRLRFSQEF